MLKKHIPVIFALCVIALAASCAKEGPNGPTGPAGPSYVGTISGHVSLYDQYGSLVLTNINKAQILLNVSGDTAIHPDINGLYAFNGITTGNYSISVTDSGYGATVLNTFQFVSGTLNKDIKLSAIPTYYVDTLIASVDSGYDSLVVGAVPADTRPRNFIVFVNSTPSVANTIGNYLLAYVKPISINSTVITVFIPAQDLYNAGFTPGSKVYYAAYGYVVNDASVYEDFTTGKKVYNSVGNAKIDSTIVP